MNLVRFGLGLVALIVLTLIWGPVITRGLWPYSERFTDAEKLETETVEARALVLTAYWMVAVGDILAFTATPYRMRDLLLINAVGLPVAVGWHFIVRTYRNKKRALGHLN